MKKVFLASFISLLCCYISAQEARNIFFDAPKKEKEKYVFSTTWRIQAAYIQDWQKSNNTYPDCYLHGGRIGATVDFSLPYHLSIQTGILYSLTGNQNNQHWRSLSAENTQEEYLNHILLKHSLDIPIHLYYTQPLWKQLRLLFLTGPTMQIGLAYTDNITNQLSQESTNWLNTHGIHTTKYDKYIEGELRRFNIQWSLGGGLEWDKYRIFAAYSFGLNNLVNKYPANSDYSAYKALMNNWNWYVGFAYSF